jgi:hypothetical protein
VVKGSVDYTKEEFLVSFKPFNQVWGMERNSLHIPDKEFKTCSSADFKKRS